MSSKVLKQQLEQAAALLPAIIDASLTGTYSHKAYFQFMECHEWELAMEQLEGLGEGYQEELPVRFWELLLACAVAMQLPDSAAYYSRIIRARAGA